MTRVLKLAVGYGQARGRCTLADVVFTSESFRSLDSWRVVFLCGDPSSGVREAAAPLYRNGVASTSGSSRFLNSRRMEVKVEIEVEIESVQNLSSCRWALFVPMHCS